MRKAILITLCMFFAFMLEFALFNFFGSWFKPNFILLFVIFFDLYFGIRHGIFAAAIGGILKDSFTTDFFGLNMFSLIVCAFLTILLKKYIYQRSIKTARVLLIALICSLNIFINYILYMMIAGVDFFEVFRHIFLPEVIVTLLVVNFTFNRLKQCVSKFSV